MTKNDARPEAKLIWDFMDEFLVECPNCQSKAIVFCRTAGTPRMSCTACVKTMDLEARYLTLSFGGEPPVDPYFNIPLWLRIPCVGHTLWAYNQQHLEFLRAYVTSELRQRPIIRLRLNFHTTEPYHDYDRNRLLESRLPKWMKLSKNREQVLAGIRKLEKKLALDEPDNKVL